MKKNDFIFILVIVLIFLPFFLFPAAYDFFIQATTSNPYLMAFAKFALLATAGEMLGLRIKKGVYNESGFGIMPRAFVWGLLGMWIAIAMKTFSVGAPVIVQSLGVEGVVDAMKGGFTGTKLLGAFAISVMMNTTFAPVFMTIHKITDAHILENNGSLKSIITPLPFGRLIGSLNWNVMWGFIFKKTIPYFWIPAHTLTFLLPAQYQVLFAAILGIVLGVLLSIGAVMARKKDN